MSAGWGVEGGGGGHHPAPGGLDPGHARGAEVGGGGEGLGGESGEGDGGGVGLVDCYCGFVVEGADLAVGWGGHGYCLSAGL